tara:strand:- start:484 stop:2208 length:1725 start_codon:yes stop_codon:yes gene_type:complete
MALLDNRPTLEDVAPFAPPEYEGPPVSGGPGAVYNQPGQPTITPTPAPAYKAPEEYTPSKDATVEGRLAGLLASGGKYVTEARGRGERTAQARGLLNSSIAASAGEKAAIETALPVALQDAKAFQEAGMAGYLGKIQGAGTTQKYEAEGGLVGTQAGASSVLSAQKAAEEAALTTLRGDVQSGMSRQDAFQKAYQTAYEAKIASGMSKQDAEEVAVLSAQKAQQDFDAQEARTASEERRATEAIDAQKYMAATEIASKNLRAAEADRTKREAILAEERMATQTTETQLSVAGTRTEDLKKELAAQERMSAQADETKRAVIAARSQDIRDEIAARERMSTEDVDARTAIAQLGSDTQLTVASMRSGDLLKELATQERISTEADLTQREQIAARTQDIKNELESRESMNESDISARISMATEADLTKREAIMVEERIAGDERAFRLQLQKEGAGYDKGLEQVRQDGANTRLDAENTARTNIADMELSSQEMRTSASTISDIGREYMAQISAIQRDPEMSEPNKAIAIDSMAVLYRQEITNVETIYGFEDLTWPEIPEEDRRPPYPPWIGPGGRPLP